MHDIPDLHALFGSSTRKERRENIINNPHLADWFSSQRLERFIKAWLYNILDATWHWFRYEYQSSHGSIHCHGTAKLRNDPGLCTLTEITLKGFLAQRQLDEDPNGILTDHSKQYELVVESKAASETVCKYSDWLLSTYNPALPDENS